MIRSEQERQRIASVDALRARGIDPYPAAAFPVTHHCASLKENFEEGVKVKLAGRLMSRRIMGKASFAELQDHEGTLQIYLNRDELCPGEDKSMYNDVFKKLLDRGDFIGIEGETFKTQVGEPSVKVTSLTVLSKAIRPLPAVKTDEEGNVHDAFTDPELRYRQRYVDLVVNPDVKKTFVARSTIIRKIREVFDAKGWMEVDTPVLQSIPGGAAARPFITHHNASTFRSTCASPTSSTSSDSLWADLTACTSSAATSATKGWTAPTTLSSRSWSCTWRTKTTTG